MQLCGGAQLSLADRRLLPGWQTSSATWIASAMCGLRGLTHLFLFLLARYRLFLTPRGRDIPPFRRCQFLTARFAKEAAWACGSLTRGVFADGAVEAWPFLQSRHVSDWVARFSAHSQTGTRIRFALTFEREARCFNGFGLLQFLVRQVSPGKDNCSAFS